MSNTNLDTDLEVNEKSEDLPTEAPLEETSAVSITPEANNSVDDNRSDTEDVNLDNASRSRDNTV